LTQLQQRRGEFRFSVSIFKVDNTFAMRPIPLGRAQARRFLLSNNAVIEWMALSSGMTVSTDG
jgi:hypothetical protein